MQWLANGLRRAQPRTFRKREGVEEEKERNEHVVQGQIGGCSSRVRVGRGSDGKGQPSIWAVVIHGHRIRVQVGSDKWEVTSNQVSWQLQ